MEEQGDLRSGEDGTEGSADFQQLRPVNGTPAPGLRAPLRPRATYLAVQVSCAFKGRGGHSLGLTGVLGLGTASGKARGLASGAAVASLGSCHGAWSCSPGPSFTAGECPLRNKDRKSPIPSQRMGLELWGTEVEVVTLPS